VAQPRLRLMDRSLVSSTDRARSAFGCPNSVEVGAHVHELTRRGRDWGEYIIAVCHPCSMRTDGYWIANAVASVSANTHYTRCYLG
jgi:hypothetical protein